jgi:hypothetical protein
MILLALSWLALASPGQAAATWLTLSWQNGGGNADGFKIERAPTVVGPWTQIAQVPVSIMFYVDTGLIPATVYYYRVRAFNACGDSAPTAVVVGTTSAAAPDPGNLDTDGDGQRDSAEILAGTNPNDNTSTLRIARAGVTGNGFEIKWPVVSGKSYQVQYCETLSGPWHPLSAVTASVSSLTNFVDTTITGVQHRFYRVMLVP